MFGKNKEIGRSQGIAIEIESFLQQQNIDTPVRLKQIIEWLQAGNYNTAKTITERDLDKFADKPELVDFLRNIFTIE